MADIYSSTDWIASQPNGSDVHIRSIFIFEDRFDLLRDMLTVAEEKGITVTFDNERETFIPHQLGGMGLQYRLPVWELYFDMNRKHCVDYVRYLMGEKRKEE